MDSYPQSGGAAPVFDLSGGHPVLDLVNTLDHRFRDEPPVELLPDYEALLSFARQSGILDPGQVRALRTSVRPQAAARALSSARELREALATVLYGNLEDRPPPAAAIRTLERHFLASEQHRELRWQETGTSDGQPRMTWQWSGAPKEAEFPVWILAGLAGAAHAVRCAAAGERLRGRSLSLAVSRYEQESHAPVVQHEDLREPHEGTQIPGTPRCRAVAAGTWRHAAALLAALRQQS